MPAAMSRGSFYDSFPATSILLLSIAAFYALEVIYHHKLAEESLLQSVLWLAGDDGTRVHLSLGANSASDVEKGQVWRLVSYAFLHGFLIHLLMNAMVLADLGRICEPLLGTERFTVVYIVSAIAGGLGSIAYGSLRGGLHVSVGASGAICGLIGLLLAFSLRHRDRDLRDQIVRWIAYLAIFSLFFPNVDHGGHAGGLLAGAVFGYFTPRYVSSHSARLWRIPFWITVAVTIAALGFAIWHRYRLPLH